MYAQEMPDPTPADMLLDFAGKQLDISPDAPFTMFACVVTPSATSPAQYEVRITKASTHSHLERIGAVEWMHEALCGLSAPDDLEQERIPL